MRDFRDAKAMAQTLRSTLATRGHKITNSQSLELIAKAFGVTDWNTLAAAIRTEPDTLRKDGSETPWDLPWSRELAGTLQRALAYAKQRRHQYATIEHLLLALTDDADAALAMRACKVDLSTLTRNLTNYIDNDLKDIVVDGGPVAMLTAGFRRVVQRGRLHAKQVGRSMVTGGDFLLGIFGESLSPAARCLDEQHLTREDVLNVLAGGDAGDRGEGAG
jgi:glyoxalase superfamily protein/ClpA/ClpB-like protein